MTSTLLRTTRPVTTAPATDRRKSLLVLVAVLHGLVPLVLLGVHWGFGVDETVYLSQLNAHVPASLFSAPRARGTTFVAAPVTLLVHSVAAVRLWLAALSAVCLYLAYRCWLRILPGMIVPLAALLFSSIWSVAYYSFEAMPNEWVAFALVAASGYTLQYLRDGRRSQAAVVVVMVAIVALFRPSDAGFAAVGLIAACVVVRVPLRLRLVAAGAAVGGVVLGSAEWVIEAYTSYGGLGARIHAAQAEQGGGGLRFSGLAQGRTLAGPLLCRAGCSAHVSFVFWAWWLVAGVLLVLALVFARGRSRRGAEFLPLLVGLAVGAQYILTVDYAAPRFLIPTYALLALPCAAGVVGLRDRITGRRTRIVLTGALATAMTIQLVVQADVIVRHIKPSMTAFTRQMYADADRLHAIGVRAPCIVLGLPTRNAAIAFTTGCSNVPNRTVAVRHAIAHGVAVAWIGTGAPPRPYGVVTRRARLAAGRPGHPFVAYVYLRRSEA